MITKGKFLVASALVLVACGSTFAQTVNMTFTNSNSEIANPYITFVQSLNVTGSTSALNGPALSATSSLLGALQNGVSYTLSSIGTISLAPNWAGDIFFSDSNMASVLGASGQTGSGTIPYNQAPYFPTNPNGAATVSGTGAGSPNLGRYNYIELAGGNNTTISPDISYINYYSVPLKITRVSDSATRGAPSSLAAMNALPSNLAALSGSSSAVIISNGGVTTRIVSPDNGSTAYSQYPSFSNYVTSSFSGSAKPINLTNTYSGHGSEVGVIATQTYTGQSVTYSGGVLTITGSSSNADVGSYVLTSTMTLSEFSSAIYAAVINYTVVYATGTLTENTGANDVFATITRDLAAGYNYGFIDSSLAFSGTAVGDLTSGQWMGLSNAQAFANAQPDNDTYYNTWAATVAPVFGDVYTFGFNDFLSGFSPELNVNTGDTLNVTLLGTSGVPEPSTTLFLTLGAGLGLVTYLRKRRRVSSSV